MNKLRVLIVDDSVVYRKILTAASEGTGLTGVIQTASGGLIALERLSQQEYDVVLIDLNMPELNGIETLKRMKAVCGNIMAIMVSSMSEKDAAIALRALNVGALDFIVKPLGEDYDANLKEIRDHLKILFAQVQIRLLASSAGQVNPEPKKAQAPVSPVISRRINGVDVVVMAASTGGPVALERVFGGFEKGLAKPILVVQHMPPEYTRVMAQRLDSHSNLRVIEGQNGDGVRAGQAIIAPGGYHMKVSGSDGFKRVIELELGDFVHGVRPSADVLFESVAQEYRGARILAVVLTGMGNDGMVGIERLKQECKCYCLVQDEATCVVYGMPRSIVEAGLADEILAIDAIAPRMEAIIKNGS